MNRRELAEDTALAAFAAGGGLLLLTTGIGVDSAGSGRGDGPGFAVDLAIGALSCAAVFTRRRWPAPFALLTAVTGAISLSSGVAAFIAVGNAGVRSRPAVAVTLAAGHQLAMIGYYFLWRVPYPFWLFWAVSMSENVAVLVLGMYLRARRQLVASLRDRVDEAVAAQRALADQARLAERTRIATEMHDVLAHRVSLIAMHAGALEIRPDQSPDEVLQAAGLIRTTARQALNELRDVVGVLREPAGGAGAGAPLEPQPTLGTIARLIAEYRRAGLNVGLDMRVTTPEAAPGPLGRDAYRIVREGLANVTKHATGTTATVTVEGGPGAGLNVIVRNKLPLNYTSPALPGSGLGLVGLGERVALAGGALFHGPEPGGDFVLRAALRWESDRATDQETGE